MSDTPTTLLSAERLTEIAALADAATIGPWHPGHLCSEASTCNCPYVLSDVYCGSVCTIDVSNGIGSIADGDNDSPPLEEAKANQRFIAAARQDVPDLLAHLDAREAAFTKALKGLLWTPEVLSQLEPADQVKMALRNNDVRRAAASLGIDLTKQPAP